MNGIWGASHTAPASPDPPPPGLLPFPGMSVPRGMARGPLLTAPPPPVCTDHFQPCSSLALSRDPDPTRRAPQTSPGGHPTWRSNSGDKSHGYGFPHLRPHLSKWHLHPSQAPGTHTRLIYHCNLRLQSRPQVQIFSSFNNTDELCTRYCSGCWAFSSEINTQIPTLEELRFWLGKNNTRNHSMTQCLRRRQAPCRKLKQGMEVGHADRVGGAVIIILNRMLRKGQQSR